MKLLIFLTPFFLFSIICRSQEKIILYYNKEWKITTKDKAAFYREASYNLDKFELNGSVADYTMDGQKNMEGNYLNGHKNGEFVFYFPNGKIESKGIYQNKVRNGRWEYFYSDGNPRQVVVFYGANANNDFTVWDYFDKQGNQQVKNGTGKWVNDSITTGLFDHTSLKSVTGRFKDSMKIGLWQLTDLETHKIIHSERYNRNRFTGGEVWTAIAGDYGTIGSAMMPKFPDKYLGKFRNTESFELDETSFPPSLLDKDAITIFKTITGKEFKIQNRKVMYPGGDYELLEFIARNVRYPLSALQTKTEGKVYIGASIDSEGNLKDVKVLYGVNKDLNNEAIRVVSLIKKWLPEIQNGKAIASALTIPVKFEIKN